MTSTQTRTVRECVASIKNGTLTSVKLVQECLDLIDASDSGIHAWTFIDREQALDRAKRMDDIRRWGKPTGALHGIPIGLKDIFDTAGVPTEFGSSIYSGRVPDAHSTVVEKLLEAGAVIVGKTATTEFAYMHPTDTCNPHNPEYSPGGSSSGSAAAVAAGHVPLALGSQTGGSTIRPASFCGVFGLKPSRGLISRRGVFQTSQTLDQVGVFGRDAGDVALLCDVLSGYDRDDVSSYLDPKPGLLGGYHSDVPVEPNFVWIDMPYANRYDDALAEGCNELMEALGKQIERIPAPRSFDALLECHRLIYDFEIFRCLESERTANYSQLSSTVIPALERAAQVSEKQYQEAMEIKGAAIEWFQKFFYDYDAILTPSAVGEAVKMGEGTGDPVCCTIWTLCGLPCLSLPLLVGSSNLPMGVQLVGGLNEDDRLMRTARWLLHYLNNE